MPEKKVSKPTKVAKRLMQAKKIKPTKPLMGAGSGGGAGRYGI